MLFRTDTTLLLLKHGRFDLKATGRAGKAKVSFFPNN
jgi:hypothetical protein